MITGKATVRVACVGDSITDGFQMPDKNRFAYPVQLGGLLGAGYAVRNFGANGAMMIDESRTYHS